jgi:hypothetical protein
MAWDSRVIPQSFLSDTGGSVTSAKFTEHDLVTLKQVVKCAGVEAHTHNAGHAERPIQPLCQFGPWCCIQQCAGQMLLGGKWQSHMWSSSRIMFPLSQWSLSKWPFLVVSVGEEKVSWTACWGCPVYVLERAIADGKKLPRLEPPSVCCINTGFSKKHAGTASFLDFESRDREHLMTGLQRLQRMRMPSHQILTPRVVGPIVRRFKISIPIWSANGLPSNQRRQW